MYYFFLERVAARTTYLLQKSAREDGDGIHVTGNTVDWEILVIKLTSDVQRSRLYVAMTYRTGVENWKR